MTSARPIVRSLRPRQWVKNVLVFSAPFAAGEVMSADVAMTCLVAFVAFCLISSAVYLVNDVCDREADRLHPVKSSRPIATGEVTVRTALAWAAFLAAAAIAVAASQRWQLAALVLAYAAVQVAYSVWLKHEPVLDLALVTTGFIMRAVAGGLAVPLPISDWFLLVTGFGSLFVVAGKRYSELQALGNAGTTRRSLVRYTDSYLRSVWSIAASVSLVGYSLWAFERGAQSSGPWEALSIIPFTVAMLRYAVDIDKGLAAEPEDIVWADHGLQLVGLVWFVLVGVGIARA